jgi:hypothetical protein
VKEWQLYRVQINKFSYHKQERNNEKGIIAFTINFFSSSASLSLSFFRRSFGIKKKERKFSFCVEFLFLLPLTLLFRLLRCCGMHDKKVNFSLFYRFLCRQTIFTHVSFAFPRGSNLNCSIFFFFILLLVLCCLLVAIYCHLIIFSLSLCFLARHTFFSLSMTFLAQAFVTIIQLLFYYSNSSLDLLLSATS